jgi:Polyketide cyclase / dehydrase and lipid transport
VTDQPADPDTGAGSPPTSAGPAEEAGRWSFTSTVRSAAPIGVVWPLIGEAARWKEWSWMTRTYLLRPGFSDPDGVGAVRRFALGPGGSSEEVVAWDPPRHLGYVAVKGLPVRRYRADVDLRSEAGGTVITWRGRFDEIVPGTGPLLRLVLARLTRGFAVRVGRYAEGLVP